MTENKIIVNTWKTRNTNWVIEPEIEDLSVEKLANEIEWLPIRVKIPYDITELSFPRYYAIYYIYYTSDIKIVDILGVRYSKGPYGPLWSPTKWGFRFGYWHPYIQILLSKTLRSWLREKKEKEKNQESPSQNPSE